MQLEPMKQIDLVKLNIDSQQERSIEGILPRKSGVNGNTTGNGLAIGCAIIVSNVFASGNRS